MLIVFFFSEKNYSQPCKYGPCWDHRKRPYKRDIGIKRVEFRENVRAFFSQGHSKTLHACNNEVSAGFDWRYLIFWSLCFAVGWETQSAFKHFCPAVVGKCYLNFSSPVTFDLVLLILADGFFEDVGIYKQRTAFTFKTTPFDDRLTHALYSNALIIIASYKLIQRPLPVKCCIKINHLFFSKSLEYKKALS